MNSRSSPAQKTRMRLTFRDVALMYRMPAGFPGDVTRTHPAEIEAAQTYLASPPTAYGQPVIHDASGGGVRPLTTTDGSDTIATDVWGFTVRPYPSQQMSGGMGVAFGGGVPPVGIIDVLRAGTIIAQLNPAAAVTGVIRGGRVFVWTGATQGTGATLHTQGGLEVAATAGKVIQLDSRYRYFGPADAGGMVEVSVNV